MGFFATLSITVLSIMLSVAYFIAMLSVVMLNVVMLRVIILNVVAPLFCEGVSDDEKSFITLSLGPNVIKLFTSVINECS
jgi:hypothetical protein